MGKRVLGIFLLGLSCILMAPAAAIASGCLGGDWYQVSKGTIGQRSIQPIRGNSGMSAQVYRHYAKVAYHGVQFSDEIAGKEVEFVSSVFDPDDIHVPDLFRQLEALPLKFDVDVVETVETNPYYDDCADIPENTKRSKITYEFSIKMPDGKIIPFVAYGEVRDTSPP
jgi:hypothetical protein